jgi:hypothetical protein
MRLMDMDTDLVLVYPSKSAPLPSLDTLMEVENLKAKE